MKIEQIGEEKFGILIGSLISQPIGDFFVCSMSWKVLQEIALNNPRMLVSKNDAGFEEYRGIQREISEARRKDLMDYVKSPYATFPTSIIINFPYEFIDLRPFTIKLKDAPEIEKYNNASAVSINDEIQLDSYILIFPIRNGIAQIIDGQHRLSAFQNFGQDYVFDLPVTIFMDQTLERQAEVFSVINGKQTRVSPSLVFDLFGITEKPTPYKVANDLVKMLNESSLSPLNNLIKILGKANDFYKGVVTQSTVAQNILVLICGDIKQAEKDKIDILKDLKLDDKPTKTKKNAPLRDFFINKEYDSLFKVLLNFFNAIKRGLPEEWNRPNTVLKKTVGINALFKYLFYLSEIGLLEGNLTEEFFRKHIEKQKNIQLNDIQLSSLGVNQIFDKLIAD